MEKESMFGKMAHLMTEISLKDTEMAEGSGNLPRKTSIFTSESIKKIRKTAEVSINGQMAASTLETSATILSKFY